MFCNGKTCFILLILTVPYLQQILMSVLETHQDVIKYALIPLGVMTVHVTVAIVLLVMITIVLVSLA